jgi:hypothetical protein
VGAPRRGDPAAARHPRPLEGRHALPALARQGALQVHGRRLRAGAHPRAGRGKARPVPAARAGAGVGGLHRPPDGPPAAATRSVVRRLPGAPGLDERRADAPAGRSARHVRRPDAHHAPAELHRQRHPDRPARRGDRRGRGDRVLARRQPAAGVVDRLHRRAVLQLRRDRDQVPAQAARRAPRGRLWPGR